ncbi:MAG: hypothetical protein R3E89_00040 [Thiolinea sp.]
MLTPDGAIAGLSYRNQPRDWQAAAADTTANSDNSQTQNLLTATPDWLLRDIITLRQRHGQPILLLDGDKVRGVVGEREIYQGLMREG